ncbi:MAG: glycosyltransferase family 2 protein [Bacteriovoracales bacterium]|nr:glycosyltransferase family 2 protein [Bacteriovoracales bacterium]
MSFEKKISVIIPAKNEEKCLPLMIDELPKDIIKEIIVVDGHSTDRTVDAAKGLGVKVIPQQGRGYGNAVNTGLHQASGEYITFMDADASYDPQSLTLLKRKIEENRLDVCFCSRYLPESGSDDDTIIRYIGNRSFSLLLRFLHGVQISDALFLYCLAKREIFNKISISSEAFDWCVEFPIKVHHSKLKYSEIPSFERKRIAGESKVNAFTDGLQIAFTLLKLKWKISRYKNAD